MATMKAYIVRAYGPDATFEPAELPVPQPGPGQVVIAVKATSLNPIDNKFLHADLGLNPELPAVLHGDVAGTIASVGPGVTEFKPGDEVYSCAGGFKGTAGALAEMMLADAALVAAKPKSLGFAEAAALPLVVLTAWEGLVDHCGMTAGQRVLVHAGTGGVGHVAVQIAKALGASVATTVSSDAKAAIVRSLPGGDGVDIINRKQETIEEYVKRLTPGGKGFDIVFDTVGDAVLEQSFTAARKWGHVVNIWAIGNHDLAPAFANNLTVHMENMSLPLVTGEGRARHGEILREAAAMVDEGKLRPLLDERRFGFTQVAQAHALFESKQHTGKIVLEPDW